MNESLGRVGGMRLLSLRCYKTDESTQIGRALNDQHADHYAEEGILSSRLSTSFIFADDGTESVYHCSIRIIAST